MKKKLVIATMLIGLALCIPTHVQASTNIAKTQTQLEKLLADKTNDTIEIVTSKKNTLTIPSGNYNKNLIINAPNTLIVNNGKFSEITVKDAIKYTENVKGNSLTIEDVKLSVYVSKNASLKNITALNDDTSLHLVANGNVSKLTINAAKVVGIHGKHTKPISVMSNDSDAKINISSLVTFVAKDIQSESKPITDTSKANIDDDKSTSESAKADIKPDLSTIQQQAYNKAYSDWLNYFIMQYQNNQSTNSNNSESASDSSQTGNKTNDESTITTPGAIEITEPDTEPNNNPTTEETKEPVEEPITEPDDSENIVEEPSEPITTYQMTFTHWDNESSFNTYTGRSQYVYVANADDNTTPLESTDWEVAVVANNENVTDESLTWTDLGEATCINGIMDSTYYENAYKLTFNENGTYYLRAKYDDQYVYSIPIVVNTDNTTYQETEFDGVTYMAQTLQASRNAASFKLTGCTPEDVEALADVTYIKYKNSSTLHRGLGVSYVRADLDSYCIYYTYNQADDYNADGELFAKTYYNENNKPYILDSYSNGIRTKSKVTTYDEQGRIYSIVTTTYDENGVGYARSGCYYTYDEEGNRTMHSGLPPVQE